MKRYFKEFDMKYILLAITFCISPVAAENTSKFGSAKKTEMRESSKQREQRVEDNSQLQNIDPKARPGNLENSESEKSPLFGANKRQGLHKNSKLKTDDSSAQDETVRARIDPSVEIKESENKSDKSFGVNKKLELRGNKATR